MARSLPALCFAALMALPAPALAQSQAELFVARELPRYVPDVEVNDLTGAQVAALYVILTSEDDNGAIRREARSVIYGIGNLLYGRPRRFP